MVVALVAACSKKAPPPVPSTDAAAPIVTASVAPIESVAIARVDAAVPEPRSAAEIRASKPPEDAHRSGSIAAWAEPDGDFSLVLVAEDKQPTKLVRRTSGEVVDLQIVTTDAGEHAVAWVSALVGGKGQVSAVAFMSADLANVSPPVTLALLGKPALESHVAMAKSPRGGVVVAYEGAGASDGVTFEVKAVTPDGKVDKLGTKKVEGGPSPDLWIVPLEDRGALVVGSSMAGGRTTAELLVPWTSAEPAPAFSPPQCGGLAAIAPEYLRGTNGEVVCLDVDARFGQRLAECIKPLKDDPERCLRIGVTAKDGTPVTPKKSWDTPVSKVQCSGKQVKLGFPGGDVTLASPSALVADWLKKKCD
jgi:hypothetical protein